MIYRISSSVDNLSFLFVYASSFDHHSCFYKYFSSYCKQTGELTTWNNQLFINTFRHCIGISVNFRTDIARETIFFSIQKITNFCFIEFSKFFNQTIFSFVIKFMRKNTKKWLLNLNLFSLLLLNHHESSVCLEMRLKKIQF